MSQDASRPLTRRERRFLRKTIAFHSQDAATGHGLLITVLLVCSLVLVLYAFVEVENDTTRLYMFLGSIGLCLGGLLIHHALVRSRAAVVYTPSARVVKISGPFRVERTEMPVYSGNRVRTITNIKTYIGEQQVGLPSHWPYFRLQEQAEDVAAEVLNAPWRIAYPVSLSDGKSAEEDVKAGWMGTIDVPVYHYVMVLMFAFVAIMMHFLEREKDFTVFPPVAFVRYLSTLGATTEFANAEEIARYDLRLHQPATVKSCTSVPILRKHGWGGTSFLADFPESGREVLSRLREELRERLAVIELITRQHPRRLDLATLFEPTFPPTPAQLERVADNPHVATWHKVLDETNRGVGDYGQSPPRFVREIGLELIGLYEAEPELVARKVNELMGDYFAIDGAPHYYDSGYVYMQVSAWDERDHSMRFESLEWADDHTLETLLFRTFRSLRACYSSVDSLLGTVGSVGKVAGVVKPFDMDSSRKALGLRPLVIDAGERNDSKVFSMAFLTLLDVFIVGFVVFALWVWRHNRRVLAKAIDITEST